MEPKKEVRYSMKPRYDDQFFARCRKADRRRAQKAARIAHMDLSEFVRQAVQQATDQVLPETQEARQSS